MHKTSSCTLRLWGTSNFRGIQTHSPYKLYWVLFSIENLRQVVETVKRIFTKEKVDRQLAGQSSSTPFISVKDSYNKWVTINMQDRLEDKIDKLTAMMGKLAARDIAVYRPFKPLVYQSK